MRIYTNIPPKRLVQDLQITGRPQSPADSVQENPSISYDDIIEKYAEEYQLDPALVKSMIARESGFNAQAVSPKGAMGLMQLMPDTAARHGVRDVFDPEENIRGGMKHMRLMLDMFGNDLSLSLAAYNAGENLVQRLGRIPQIKETHDYVRAITRLYGKKQMELPVTAARSSPPPVFRYLDARGVEHLTNIAPVRRSEADPMLWTQSQP
ncbi:MAG: lytic transglycosylase domain-containing protein [Acidobacteria bacterium]|nr:lytic transglycosylase domain-containing protein [Acidobacteriota bacterium]